MDSFASLPAGDQSRELSASTQAYPSKCRMKPSSERHRHFQRVVVSIEKLSYAAYEDVGLAFVEFDLRRRTGPQGPAFEPDHVRRFLLGIWPRFVTEMERQFVDINGSPDVFMSSYRQVHTHSPSKSTAIGAEHLHCLRPGQASAPRGERLERPNSFRNL